jgi:hypothetical protein
MKICAVTLLICVGLTAGSDGQVRPDFSGTWVLDEKRSGSATHEAFVGPVVWTIQHTADMLVVERRRGTAMASFTYPIREKAASKGPVPIAPAAEAPGNVSYWDGAMLVMETHQDVQGKTVTTREALTLANMGEELVAERVLEVEHGYTLRGAQNFSAVKDFFTKRAQQ